jgi:AAA domain-containing protein
MTRESAAAVDTEIATQDASGLADMQLRTYVLQVCREAARHGEARRQLVDLGLESALSKEHLLWPLVHALCDMERRGEPTDYGATLAAIVMNKDREAGLASAAMDEADKLPATTQLPWYVGQIREAMAKRRAAEDLAELVKECRNGTPPAEVIEQMKSIQARLESGDAGLAIAAEDLADILDRPAPPTPWAAHGLIARGDIGLVSGAGGIGKTWIGLDLCLELAVGRSLFGRFDVAQPFRIAILDLESRPWEADQRLHRIAAGSGLKADDLRGKVQVIRQRLRLDDRSSVRRLIASLRAWGTDFLLIDSFRRCHAGDDNKSEVVSALFLDALDAIRTELDCGCVLTDHTRKPTGESDLDSPDLALRGSTDKRNMADWHVGIEVRQEHIAFIPTKTRHSRLPAPFLLELAGLADDDQGDGPVTVKYAGALDTASDRVQDACIALLDEAGDGGLLRGEIIGRCGYSARAATDALSALKMRRRVYPQKEGKQARYTLDKWTRAQRAQSSAPTEQGAQ